MTLSPLSQLVIDVSIYLSFFFLIWLMVSLFFIAAEIGRKYLRKKARQEKQRSKCGCNSHR